LMGWVAKPQAAIVRLLMEEGGELVV